MKRNVRGFTLLESLICLAMLGVLLVALSSMMLSINVTRSRVDASIVAEDRFAQTQVFLYELISGAVLVTQGGGNDKRTGFYGQEDVIEFQANLPNSPSNQVYFCKLFLSRGELVFSFQNTGARQSAKTENIVLISGIRSIKFSFLDKHAEIQPIPAGVKEWTTRNKLPQGIRIELKTRGASEWPALYVKMKYFDSVGGSK